MTIAVLIALAALVFLPTVGNAQALRDSYPFTISGTLLQQGALVPVGDTGAADRRIVLKDGQLQREDGSRIRFAGTSLQWGACFPDTATADILAARFAALGYNIVRFQQFDNTFWSDGSILAEGSSTGALNPVTMQRLDYFVAALKRAGIYSTFAFHGAWAPRAGDGIADTLGWGARTGLMLDPRVQRIHRSIIWQFMEHRNAYTGLTYAEDPCIAWITAAEDASFTIYWLYSRDITSANPFGGSNVGQSFHRTLDSSWSAWLRTRYANQTALANAWRLRSIHTGNLLQNAGFNDPFSTAWTSFAASEGVQAVVQFSDADKVEGESSLRVRINSVGSNPQWYNVMTGQQIPMIRANQLYRLQFRAKTSAAKGSRPLIVTVMNSGPPYDNFGLNETVTLSSAWQPYEMIFSGRPSDTTRSVIWFMMGGETGDVFLDDVRLEGVDNPGVLPNEQLAASTVQRHAYWDQWPSPQRWADLMTFYRSRLDGLFSGVRRLVRDTLQSQVLLSPSLRGYGYFDVLLAPDYDVYASADFPSIENSYLFQQYGGSFWIHGSQSVEGKAFVLSHGSTPYPARHQTEQAIIWPAYAGVQDWDGVITGVHGSSPRSQIERIDSNSRDELESKPHVLALMPFSSSLLRYGGVAPTTKSLTITPSSRILDQPNSFLHQAYSLSLGGDGRIPMIRRMRMAAEPSSEESVYPQAEVSLLAGDVDIRALDAENGQVFWNGLDGRLRVVTPTHIAASGALVGESFQANGLQFEYAATAPHATIAMHSMDTSAIGSGGAFILTVSSMAANADAVFSPAGSLQAWGQGPLHMEGGRVRITLPAVVGMDSVSATPISMSGLPEGPSIAATVRSNGRFVLDISSNEAGTPWFRIAYHRRPTSVSNDGVQQAQIHVSDGQLRIAAADDGTVTIVDAVGRMRFTGTVAEARTQAFEPGLYAVVVTENTRQLRTVVLME
ncbi:MAG: carbohydrate binding domain-containing protein [Candidatus Kapabacteria bacterium]|nr:carbohydrate binding domain-containing protein [Candidatus Kapabacteria bacterium]